MPEPNLPRAHSEFARLEQRTKLILTSAGEGIYGLDAEGNATFVNPAAARMLGWPIEELIGQAMHANHHHTHVDGSAYDRTECPIYAAFKDGQVHSIDDEVFWRRDGSHFPIEYTSTPIHEDGALVGAVVVFRDITLRRRTEQDLRAAMAEIEALKSRVEAENDYLQEEIRADREYGDLLGDSSATVALRKAIETVAPSDASVLVTGETGTGKELVARAIHALGPRRSKPLIKVNCASIPRELFESEFFGHAQGAFTGAIRDRIGRFELADEGTLFLDEVGEIPLEMQSKLLRVLQEGEFERVGEERTRRVDVRVIAATNRDLRAAAASGRFRQDLYYRLNVFPIEIAPLRYRTGDVGPLAARFLLHAGRKLHRKAPRLTATGTRQLENYTWPGNVRELQNVVERAMITSRGSALEFDLPDRANLNVAQQPAAATNTPRGVIPEAEMRRRERDNLIAALAHTGGRIYGEDGAAELLGLKPTTLASRLKKFGLSRVDSGARPHDGETAPSPVPSC